MMATSNEFAYLRLLRKVTNDGEHTNNRTGVPTRTVFGEQMRFTLHNDTLPVITTRHIKFRQIVAELIWFLSGSTDQQVLEQQSVKIWKANSTLKYLKQVHLADRYRPYRDLGPIYGHQWRHFGAPYTNCENNYDGKGIDQVANVISDLQHNPTSRRIIISSWNPAQLDDMTLPPCHCLVQFHIHHANTENARLSCQLYQRSADLAIGAPYNITSYSLLTHIFASMCNYKCGEFIYNIGNAHIYENHIAGIKVQLQRIPYVQPKLRIVDPSLLTLENFTNSARDSLLFERLCNNFELVNYRHYDPISYKLVP